MRKGVIVCGANGERGVMLERAIEKFGPRNTGKMLQFSICTVATSPIMISMSGVDMNDLIAINGCRNRCCDRILEKAGMKVARSVVLDDATDRKIGPCQFTSDWDFPDIKEDEILAFLKLMEDALK
ncbi:MAG: hypothetical protein HPY73_06545 [Methanomassiliicoccales archaeon]|nr:MAG: hypothetical protein HPY73_06545 [Methanomassiliicoccales archaeon]